MKRVLLFTGLMLLAPTVSFAQNANSTGGKGDQAGATALFYEARNLMQKGNFKDACPKLEESLRLDYGIGTEFNLADCYEKTGKTASAWSGFLNVASQAKTQNQAQREKVARDRAKALEPKLPKMIIEVPAPPPGIEVKRDGVLVGTAAWGTAVPVDPGTHKVVVTAPGKQAWETSVNATEANTTRVTVPRDLPNAPVAAAPVAKPATPAPVVAPPAQTATTTTTVSEPAPSNTPADFPEPVVEHNNTQRTIGWVASGVGLVGLGVGAGFGINSMAKRRESNDHCDGNLCNQTGVDLRDDAIRSGNVSTIATIAGGAALVGGIILLVTAPSNERQKAATTAISAPKKNSITAVPNVAQGGGGLMLQGVFQ
jgi:hypothetical protein